MFYLKQTKNLVDRASAAFIRKLKLINEKIEFCMFNDLGSKLNRLKIFYRDRFWIALGRVI